MQYLLAQLNCLFNINKLPDSKTKYLATHADNALMTFFVNFDLTTSFELNIFELNSCELNKLINFTT